ncbi:ribonuclease H2 subunit A [Ceratobasidium sp. AG-Ba]|nr:ribonuclease H2 subunit A [Ceratobasidium sp. AG-Ba]
MPHDLPPRSPARSPPCAHRTPTTPPSPPPPPAMSSASTKQVAGPCLARSSTALRTVPSNTATRSTRWDLRANSKTLTHATRAALLKSLTSDPDNLAWSVRVLAPQDISASMLRHPPTNLNQQSQAATVSLIRDVMASGIDIAEIYVDALGPSVPYQKYLSQLFPTAQVTVCPKADSIYTIVGAASVAAKVTRDAWIENWMFSEPGDWDKSMGSGYPSDPNTKAWLKSICEPTFGFPSIVRFSWGTSKTALENNGHNVTWIDENQASLVKAFGTATGLDKGRPAFAKDLAIRSMSEL